MTMHAAKGLEFDVVFLTWLGRRFIPSPKIFRGKRGFCFGRGREDWLTSALRRAKKRAFLSFAMRRAYQGDWMDAELPSKSL